MLLKRSISYQVILLLIITVAKSEKFKQKYEVADANSDSNLGQSGGGFKQDYSKFYSSPAAAAIKDGKYVPESETSATSVRAKGIHIDNDPLGVQKYIDDAHNIKEEDPDESKPGPNYITYEVPQKTLSRYKLENEYEAEIHALDKEYSIPTFYKPKDDIKIESAPKPVVSDTKEDTKTENTRESSQFLRAPSFSFDVDHYLPSETYNSNEGHDSNYEQPHIPQYYTRHTSTPTETHNSNEKYSFEPSNDKFAEISPVETFGSSYDGPESSDQKASNCKKVVKQSVGKDVPMTCHICKDPKTGASSERCAYTSAPDPKSYYSSKNEKYSNPHQSENYRFKRYAPKKSNKKEEYVDPYEFAKAESQKYFSKPEEFESEHYKAKDFYEEYKFPADYFAGDSNEKSESEIQSEKLMKEGGTCKEVKKQGMNCKVCKNEKTGGSYEQCSYTSAPNEKKYAYVSEKKTDGNGDVIEDKQVESSEPKAAILEKDNRTEPLKAVPVKSEKQNLRTRAANQKQAKLIDDNPYDIPKHFVESTRSQKLGSRGLDPELYGSADSSVENLKQVDSEDDEYHRKMFPQKENQNVKQGEASNQKEYATDSNKKDVEKVLEEFTKKDRSTCQKAEKNGMTCFLCVNKDGTQHEECMFIAENKPQASHIAYHEVEEFKSGGGNPREVVANEMKEAESSPQSKRKRFFKKVTTDVPLSVSASSSEPVRANTKQRPLVSQGVRKYRPAVSIQAEPSEISRTTTKFIQRTDVSASSSEPIHASSKQRPVVAQGARKFRPAVSIQAAPSEISRTTTKFIQGADGGLGRFRMPRKLRRTRNFSGTDPVVAESKSEVVKVKAPVYKEPSIKTPEEFTVGDTEGAYSAETKPVYSTAFGVSLPKYMLAKSEFEKNFDSFAASG